MGHLSDRFKLGEGGERRFVGEVVLFVPHDPHPELGVVGGDGSAGHHLDPRVLEHLGHAGGHLRSRELSSQSGGFAGVTVIYPLELGTGLGEAVAHAVDMPVVETDGGEDELAFLAGRRRLALRRVAHPVSF